MKKRVCFLILLLIPTFSNAVEVAAKHSVNNIENGLAKANEPAQLKIKVYDPTGKTQFHHFHPMHDKEMHLLVIKNDLSTFAHIHPLRPHQHSTEFSIGINQPIADPDSQDALSAVTTGGDFFLFAETMPMPAPMVTLPMDLKAEGPLTPEVPVVADAIEADGFIHKVDQELEMKIQLRPYTHCDKLNAGFLVLIHERTNAGLRPVENLQTWLASFAHVVLVSNEGLKAADKQVVHAHAVWPLPDDPNGPRGPDVELSSDSHTGLKEGLHKAWLQFKYKDKIRTVPFAFELLRSTAGIKLCL
jgi:hypothetical protein